MWKENEKKQKKEFDFLQRHRRDIKKCGCGVAACGNALRYGAIVAAYAANYDLWHAEKSLRREGARMAPLKLARDFANRFFHTNFVPPDEKPTA